jgi:putative oxidoreductase
VLRFSNPGLDPVPAGRDTGIKVTTSAHNVPEALRTAHHRLTADFCILLARIFIGLIFIQSGWSKLSSWDANVSSLVGRGVPYLFAYLAAPTESICGVGVIFGIATGYAALLMLIFTIVATGISHRYWQYADPAQFRNQSANFWKNVSMMGGMVLLFVTGGGRFSIDGLLRWRGGTCGR